MKTPILAAALAVLAAVPVLAAPDASFDQGVDVSALLSQAKDAAKKDATVVTAQTVGGMRYDVDCTNVNFGPNDKPTSDGVTLRSQEWITECQPTGDPRQGGGQACWDRPGQSWTQEVRVTILNRLPLMPWEHDSFRVCLSGPWINTDVIQAAYGYKVVSGADTGDVVVETGWRTPEPPDPLGVLADLSAGLKMNFTDKWASQYSGESIVLKIELKKVVSFWPDSTVLTKEITLPVAAAYPVDLNQYLADFSAKPEAGRQYYAKYSIQRVGRLSDSSTTPTLETAKVVYAPSLLAFAR
jgi:hypothetical protein